MELDTTLREARDEVIEDAYAGLQTSTHAHYERAGEAFTRARLAELFDLVVDAIATTRMPRGAHVR